MGICMDRRKLNKVGCKGYKVSNETIIKMYIEDNLTMKEIGTKLGISHWTVLDRLKRSGIRKNTRHKVNHSIFSVPNEENCYWAGFIAADGCINKNKVDIELQHSDSNHLKQLCLFAGRDDKLWTRERNRDDKIFKYSSVSLISKRMVTDLKDNFNIIPNKSLILKPPINISNGLIHHYIRGYIDGDGCIGWEKHNDKPRVSIVSGSKHMVSWIKNNISLISSRVGNPSILCRKNMYELFYSGHQVYGILHWLYSDSTPQTRLQRKYERYKEYLTR